MLPPVLVIPTVGHGTGLVVVNFINAVNRNGPQQLAALSTHNHLPRSIEQNLC